jgi:hypothetical protein
MHLLSEALPGAGLVARSTTSGFIVYGEVPTRVVLECAVEGLRRLQAGHSQLAVHPNCGTGLVLAGVLAGLGSFLVLGTKRRTLAERMLLLPAACAAATAGVMLARRLGPVVQAKMTTTSDVAGMRVTGATSTRQAGILSHHVHIGT